MSEDFYIGYLPKMPRNVAKVIRVFVVFAFGAACGLAILVWIGQKPFAKSFFEYDLTKEFEGMIQAAPIPFLLVENSQKSANLPIFSRFPLVAEGKHGVGDEVKSLDGQNVKLKGKLIYRDDLQMIEVVTGSIENVDKTVDPTAEKSESLGNFSLRGEIVDSKCYLGVMNPGRSKPHRECAVRCLSGGVPPLFIVKETGGKSSALWLVSTQGTPVNKEILDFVAEPIEMTGEVRRTGDQLYFYCNPNTIKRLP